jgi:uncharacterized peroxidase-related enzyme
MHHHGEALRALTADAPLVNEILADPRGAALPPRWRVLADFAIRLTELPARLTDADAASLREAGLGDEGVHDVVAITAYFNFVNRLAEGVRLPLESDGA